MRGIGGGREGEKITVVVYLLRIQRVFVWGTYPIKTGRRQISEIFLYSHNIIGV